jgi:hypothetical protein
VLQVSAENLIVFVLLTVDDLAHAGAGWVSARPDSMSDGREAKEACKARGVCEARGPRGAREADEAREAREAREAWEAREAREARKTPETPEAHDARDASAIVIRVVTSAMLSFSAITRFASMVFSLIAFASTTMLVRRHSPPLSATAIIEL